MRLNTSPQDTYFSEDLSDFGDIVEIIGTLASAPAKSIRAAHIQAAAAASAATTAVPFRPLASRSLTTVLGRAAAALLAVVVAMSGMAAEAMLPTPVQSVASRVAQAFGIHIPAERSPDSWALGLCDKNDTRDDRRKSSLTERCEDEAHPDITDGSDDDSTIIPNVGESTVVPEDDGDDQAGETDSTDDDSRTGDNSGDDDSDDDDSDVQDDDSDDDDSDDDDSDDDDSDDDD